MNKEIPITEAKKLAKNYNYDQIIILALKKSKTPDWFDGWSTTFNKNKSKCKFLGIIAKILHYNLRSFYSNERTTDEYYRKVSKAEA